jgi:tetratricopeptide (TPR) repeat protein
MVRKSRRSPADLPQQPETWHVAVRHLRIWITPPEEDPTRPFVVLILSLDFGTIQKGEIVPEPPNPEQMEQILSQAMNEPPQGVGQKAHRPMHIEFEDADLAAALAPALEKIGIEAKHNPRPEVVDEVTHDLELHLRGKPEPPGLLSVRGVTPELVGGFFAAAAEFYRAAPWVQLTDQHTLAVRVSPERQARFAQVMGAAGIEYGLAIYRRWKDVERVFEPADHPLEMFPPEGGHSFFFEDVSRVPFDDLEAIERYGWEVADKQAYPIPIVYKHEDQVARPSRADLAWYEAALRAIPIFIRDHLQPDGRGDYLPAEATLSVPTHAGETSVYIKYPGGTLSRESRPVHMAEWPQPEGEEEVPAFDRRAMEGMMAQLGERFGSRELQKAQDLMYQAWEERNPGRRIILAHEALAISPDCADAYVLLAEEEAGSLGHALEYYQQGVEAGERALGKAYFKENAGHFWGLLETRPYMRARQGLANTLWELGREEESLPHYRDMLRLNPGDNQGIRYALLNLLLTLDRDVEAWELLEQYEEDWTAEWLYTRALLAFRRAGGASQEAEEVLGAALGMNPHVPAYLTTRKRIPAHLPDYIGLGDENEAVTYAAHYLSHWRRTPGAMDWLRSRLSPAGRPKPSKASKGKGGRRRRRSGKK